MHRHTVLKMLQTSTFTLVSGRSFPLKEPTIVPHHARVKTSLVSLFHSTNILVKPFAMLITHSTQVIWEEG